MRCMVILPRNEVRGEITEYNELLSSTCQFIIELHKHEALRKVAGGGGGVHK